MLCFHRWPHFEQGVYTGDLQSSTPNCTFLWLCFFSEVDGHLIPIAVMTPTHISSSQVHILIPREQAAWGHCFIIVVVGFWNLILLIYALWQVILCKLWSKFLQLCLCEQIKHHWGTCSWLYKCTSSTIIFLTWHLGYFGSFWTPFFSTHPKPSQT